MAESISVATRANRIIEAVFKLIAAIALCLASLWATLAIWYQAPLPAGGRIALGGLFAAVFLLSVVALRVRKLRSLVWPAAVACALVLVLWWSGIRPSQNRDWQPDVSRQSRITIRGDDVVVRDVRMFDWTGPETGNARWEDRLYSLSDLRGMDFFTSTWGSDLIAHTAVSFLFGSGPPLVVSLEIRKERGEQFSPWAGFVKKYELSFIAADESDVIKVRTNRRGEIVHRYRIDARPENIARLLRHYAELSAELEKAPRFYHTIWTNCTTAIYTMVRTIGPEAFPFDYRVLVSGKSAEYLYDLGFIDNSQPFDEVKRRADITMRAKLADSDPNYSAAIRR